MSALEPVVLYLHYENDLYSKTIDSLNDRVDVLRQALRDVTTHTSRLIDEMNAGGPVSAATWGACNASIERALSLLSTTGRVP